MIQINNLTLNINYSNAQKLITDDKSNYNLQQYETFIFFFVKTASHRRSNPNPIAIDRVVIEPKILYTFWLLEFIDILLK